MCFTNEHPDLKLREETNAWYNPSLIFTVMIKYHNYSLEEGIFLSILSLDIWLTLCMYRGSGVGGTAWGAFRMAHVPSVRYSCAFLGEGDIQVHSARRKWTPSQKMGLQLQFASCHIIKRASAPVLWAFQGKLSTQNLTKKIIKIFRKNVTQFSL